MEISHWLRYIKPINDNIIVHDSDIFEFVIQNACSIILYDLNISRTKFAEWKKKLKKKGFLILGSVSNQDLCIAHLMLGNQCGCSLILTALRLKGF